LSANGGRLAGLALVVVPLGELGERFRQLGRVEAAGEERAGSTRLSHPRVDVRKIGDRGLAQAPFVVVQGGIEQIEQVEQQLLLTSSTL